MALLAVIGITYYVFSIRDRVEEFAELGFFGAFRIMLIANATVILPAPGIAVIFAMGGVLNPLGVALAASQTQISGQDGSQYQYRSFDSETMADLRFSF